MAGFTDSTTMNESDRLLPSHNVLRIIRQSLPNGCKISSEVKEVMLEATSEFIGFITNHSVEQYMVHSKRKTLLKNDVISSLNDLDLNIFVPVINAYLLQPNQQKLSTNKTKRNSEANHDKHDAQESEIQQ